MRETRATPAQGVMGGVVIQRAVDLGRAASMSYEGRGVYSCNRVRALRVSVNPTDTPPPRRTARPPRTSTSKSSSMRCTRCRRAISPCACRARARGRGQNLRRIQYHRRRQSAHSTATRARGRGGGTAGQDAHARALRAVRGCLGRHGRLGQYADRRSAVADHGGHAHGDRGGARRSAADRAAGCRRPRAQGRVPALRQHRQHHDQAALGVHLRSDARRARGGHRRQARRPGAGARGHRRVEGPHREREFDGVES